MKAFIVSLPNRLERRRGMVDLMARIGIADFEFIDPVPKDKLPEPFRGMQPSYGSLNATIVERVLNRAELFQTEPFLVFEDDAIERVDAWTVLGRIRGIIEELRNETWDMVYLEYCMESCEKGSGKIVARANKPYCTAAMLYNPSGIPRIRSCILNENKLLDFSYARCIDDRKIHAFVSMPALFAQDASYGAGDLAHMSPAKVQWWLNLFIRMYPDDDDDTVNRQPRLPSCWNSRELLTFVRWGHVFTAIMIIILTSLLIFYRARISAWFVTQHRRARGAKKSLALK